MQNKCQNHTFLAISTQIHHSKCIHNNNMNPKTKLDAKIDESKPKQLQELKQEALTPLLEGRPIRPKQKPEYYKMTTQKFYSQTRPFF